MGKLSADRLLIHLWKQICFLHVKSIFVVNSYQNFDKVKIIFYFFILFFHSRRTQIVILKVWWKIIIRKCGFGKQNKKRNPFVTEKSFFSISFPSKTTAGYNKILTRNKKTGLCFKYNSFWIFKALFLKSQIYFF